MTNDFTIKLARHQSSSFATWSGFTISILNIFFPFPAKSLDHIWQSYTFTYLMCVLK